MGKRNKQVDAYIENAAEFAQPILSRLRDIVHEACPEVAEEIKWRCPHFTYKGMMCGMAAFKKHCLFHFWREKQLFPDGEMDAALRRLTSVETMPPRKLLLGYVHRARELNEEGAPVRPRTKPKSAAIPKDLSAALAGNAAAAGHFAAFSASKKRDYVEWLTEAKTEATRKKRLATAVEWIAEGKGRNWKYEKS